ncbi:hypothetical protein AZ34_03465 [Hylemonella gracilis str. Niagara R]|uniref:Uncharacterized protein n=1 Tax=Hylemonella gracilis str. Niagara R TaxID=1458275 RepID=A0A016XE91_9BURK|nr:hypothetical protein AZ34_03465 [Hylemonella gracilis str. Niagara R]
MRRGRPGFRDAAPGGRLARGRSRTRARTGGRCAQSAAGQPARGGGGRDRRPAHRRAADRPHPGPQRPGPQASGGCTALPARAVRAQPRFLKVFTSADLCAFCSHLNMMIVI